MNQRTHWHGAGELILIFALSISIVCVNASTVNDNNTLKIGIAKVYDRIGFFSPGMGHNYYQSVIYPVNSPLVYEDISGELKPALAKSWENTDGGKTWIIHLDEKAKWHDGQPVTSEDLKFSSEFNRKRDSRVDEFMKEYLDSIQTPDEHTLIYKLKKPFSPFLSWLTPAGLSTIIPKHIWEGISPEKAGESEDMIGCGPFILEKFDKDRNVIVFKSSDNYFGEKPKVSKVELHMFKGEDTMLMALKKGEIDVAGMIKGLSVPSLLNENDIKIKATPSGSVNNLIFNMRNYPLNITAVRQAMAYCIDYNQITETSTLNYGQAGGYAPDISPDMWWFNPDATRYTRNVTTANRLLNSVGFNDTDKDGIRELPDGRDLAINLYVPGPDANYMRVAEMISKYMKEAGIKVEVRGVDYSVWTDEFLFKHTFDTIIEGTTLIDSPFKSAYIDLIFCDMPGYKNVTQKFMNSVDSLLSESSTEKQKKISYDIQQMVAKDVPGVSLYSTQIIDAYRSDKFGGLVQLPFDGIVNYQSMIHAAKVK
ncbi:MAG: ABC transporter substrate-binding protein [Methanotrichaceae archaeon]